MEGNVVESKLRNRHSLHRAEIGLPRLPGMGNAKRRLYSPCSVLYFLQADQPSLLGVRRHEPKLQLRLFGTLDGMP